MSPTRKTSLSAALAAVMLAGSLPTAALAAKAPAKPGLQKQHQDKSKNPPRGNAWGYYKKDRPGNSREERRDDRRDKDHDDRRWDSRDDRRDDPRWGQWGSNRNDREDDRWRDRDDSRDHRRDDWQSNRDEAERRQDTKNEWRNLAIAAGGLAAVGAILREPSIIFAGAAGALYSVHRYEQDRRSQSAASRARAGIFSQSYFYRDGRRYERQTVTRNGDRYYQFVRK